VTPQFTMAGPALVGALTELVNKVYADGEKGLWKPGAARTDPAEIASLIERGEIAVARVDGRLVGAVRVRVLDEERGELGMLVAAPEQQGTGIGRELVRYAEQWGRERGLAIMQLELLMPVEWEHPVKEFLRAWYTRIGYRQVSVGDLAEDFPRLAAQLATPCTFLIFHKTL
jgi:GNAT superfamily N-acetyltransferase